MKLLTQFSIPNPSKADLVKKNNRTSKTLKKAAKEWILVELKKHDHLLWRYLCLNHYLFIVRNTFNFRRFMTSNHYQCSSQVWHFGVTLSYVSCGRLRSLPVCFYLKSLIAIQALLLGHSFIPCQILEDVQSEPDHIFLSLTNHLT